MALRLATVRKPPKKPPTQERKAEAKPVHNEPVEREVKYDHATGGAIEVDPDRPRNKYPSCDLTKKVARCAICGEVKSKEVMQCLGQNYHEKGSLLYIWRCKTMTAKDGKIRAKGCEAGSESWLKHYKHKSALGSLWNFDLNTDKRIRHSEEVEMAVGKQIVQKRMEKLDIDMKALSKRKELKRAKRITEFVAKFAAPKKKIAKILKVGDEKSGKQMRSKRRGRSFTVRPAR